MATTQELAGGTRDAHTRDAQERSAARGEDARVRARAYLDLWERHITQSAAEAPIRSGIRRPA